VPETNNKRLRTAGIKSFLLASVMLALQMIIFFISAGHIVGPRPWAFFGASFMHYAMSTVVQYKLDPELLVQRLKRKREDSKLWDEILMRVSNLMVLIAVPVMAGKVISSGPYKIVRHPGYLAGILYTLSIPLIMGSVFTFVPVGIYVILFIIRASLEDRTLHEELDGYSEYARQVKHKLFPGIW